MRRRRAPGLHSGDHRRQNQIMNSRLMLRTAVPIGVVSALLLGAAAVTAWNVHRLQENAADLLAVNVASLRAAEEYEIGLREIRNQLDLFLLTGDACHLAAVPELRREIEHWLAEADRVATTETEQRQMAKVRAGHEHFFREYDRLSRQVQPAELAPQIHALINDVLTKEILEPAHEYLDFNEQQLEDGTQQNRQLSDRLVLGLLLLGVCVAGAGLLGGFGIARWVNRSIVQLSLPVRDAAGKLSAVAGPITLSAAWGWDELESALHKMAGQIGTVINRLHQTEREALRAEQLAKVGQMAAGIAHEVRNPLMAMKILVQAAAEHGTRAHLTGRDLTVLEEEICRLERSIQTFLDFARPPQPEKRTFDLSAVVRQTFELVAERARQQEVRLVCDLGPKPVSVEADQGQVRQVLLNLLLNSLDAVRPGGTIRVCLAAPACGPRQGSDWLSLCVTDDGTGLPPDLGRKIFEPFFSSKPTGMGLGLSICRRIVEAHGGAIDAADRPEGGAAFTFSLPRAQVVELAAGAR